MINQTQIASSYPIHVPYTRAELLAERASLVASGLDPMRLEEIDDILTEADEGLVVLMDDV
jgi:hypothetical protein